MHFLKFLKTNHKSLYQEFNKNEELLQLLKAEKVRTFFQPILSLGEGSTVGFEILNRPVSTRFFPTTDIFYDYVGESRHVFKVEQFIRNLALERFTEQVNHTDELKDTLVFLNIQPQVLADPQYQEGITLELLAKHNLSPDQFVLELTEKESVVNYKQFERIIEHYREQGFRIAVDDVGTGYNSLQTIMHLKPEYIKIDKSLIRNIDEQREKQHLVELILELATKSNTYVLAEGIETESELRFLENIGIDLGQGYKLGKPKQKLEMGTYPMKLSKKENLFA